MICLPKNKKGQLDFPIITWVIIVFGLILIAPIMLKVLNSIHAPLSSSLGNISGVGGEVAQTTFNSVMDKAVNFWDKVILAMFIFATLLMLISAFLIDTHPFWIILYIILTFLLVLFSGNLISALDGIYNSASFAAESANLVFVNALRENFGTILVGIIIITGIIMYGKIAWFGSGGQKR